MEYKFGEMDSAEEINLLAENLANEGDIDSLKAFAAENGLSDCVEGYLQGELLLLCDSSTAAVGKIEAEEKDLKPDDLLKDWVEYLKGEVFGDEEFARLVRKKGKSLKGMIGHLLKWSFKHQHEIDKDIVKAAGVNAGKVTFGIPGMRQAKKLIWEYYQEEAK